MIAALIRCVLNAYPFTSGAVSIADSAFCRALAGNRPDVVTAQLWKGPPIRVRMNDRMGRRIYFAGAVDRKLESFMASLIRPGDVALDIGANFGAVTMRLAHHGATVHSFEPQPELAQLIRESSRLNGFNVFLHEIALSDRDGTTNFTLSPTNSGLGHVGGDGITVRTAHAGVFLNSLALSRVRLVKIDVEGHEVEVFHAAREWFRNTRPDFVVFEEFYNAGISSSLSGIGYDIRRLHGCEMVATAQGVRHLICK